jgi:hypothetical protein
VIEEEQASRITDLIRESAGVVSPLAVVRDVVLEAVSAGT